MPWVLGKVLNIARVTQGSKHNTIWLNMSEQDVNMSGFTIKDRDL